MQTLDFSQLDKVWPQTKDLVAVWVFGSAKDGKLREGSDLDIALLFKKYPSLEVLTDLSLRVEKTLGIDKIDICILNECSPILRFEAISGQKLYSSNLDEEVSFASLTAREYEDSMGLLKKAKKLRSLYSPQS